MKSTGLFLFVAMLALPVSSLASAGSLVRLKNSSESLQYELQNGVKLTAISKELGLYHSIPTGKPALAKSLSTSKVTSLVYKVPNHKVTLRGAISKLTSDPMILEQWNLGLDDTSIGINAVDSWRDFGSRSLDASSNEIVIAIVDGGFDINHPDLLFNKWTNKNEIANNGKDDDGNGYIDDMNGWDVSSNSGRIFVADHGTHVAGIIGARGNNYRGISGVNQRARIMYVSSGDLGDTASTMAAYAYILKQKQLWIESKGTKGANVVAVNSSFGIDGAQCADSEYVVWNDMINELGKSGILSVAATSNFEVNVDKNGDIPTSCDSPYLITVTNSNRDGSKATGLEWDLSAPPVFENVGSGFGSTHIDLAAPGEEILSTAERPSTSSTQIYNAQSGTSFSTPHVAGAIGFLHSVAPLEVNKRYMQNPASVALELKAALLENVTPIASMKTLTATGGILNLHQASLALQTSSTVMASAQ